MPENSFDPETERTIQAVVAEIPKQSKEEVESCESLFWYEST